MDLKSDNIISCYPFEKNMNVLLVGKNLKTIENFLQKNCNRVLQMEENLDVSILQGK